MVFLARSPPLKTFHLIKNFAPRTVAGQIAGIDLTVANQSTQTSSGIFKDNTAPCGTSGIFSGGAIA